MPRLCFLHDSCRFKLESKTTRKPILIAFRELARRLRKGRSSSLSDDRMGTRQLLAFVFVCFWTLSCSTGYGPAPYIATVYQNVPYLVYVDPLQGTFEPVCLMYTATVNYGAALAGYNSTAVYFAPFTPQTGPGFNIYGVPSIPPPQTALQRCDTLVEKTIPAPLYIGQNSGSLMSAFYNVVPMVNQTAFNDFNNNLFRSG